MIIDVIDLKLNTLNFNKRYETLRYKRGKNIYNNGFVQVDKVDKKNEKNYYVEATVEGNYDTYITTLEISGETITNSTCTCEDYNNGNLCKHIIATSMEIIEPHYASTEEGQKRLKKEKEEKHKIFLEEIKRKQEEERKKREYERKYYNGIETIESYKQSFNRNLNKLDLPELYEQAMNIKNNKSTNLATSIRLEYNIDIIDNNTLRVSFKIGQKRMYILNNITNFYNAYLNQQELYYGKQLNFIPKRENFLEEFRPIFDLIIKYAEMINYTKKYNKYDYYGDFNKYIYISNENIEEFFKLNNNKELILNTFEGQYKYNFTDEKLDIYCILKKEMVEFPKYDYYWYDNNRIEKSEELVLRLNIQDYFVIKSNKNIYVFYNYKIYTLPKDKKIVKMFELFENQSRMLIPEDKLEEFEKYVFPQIPLETNQLSKPIVKNAVIVNKLASKILLDADENGNILLELKFCYVNYEFNILESDYQKYVKDNNIVRDIPSECEIIKKLFIDGFEIVKEKKQFIMKNTDDIYEFLSSKIESYMNEFEVLVTEKFKNKQIKQPKISSIGIKVNNGLLELDLSKFNINLDEMKNILKDYSVKKKYFKLKSGDLLDLTQNEDLSLLEEMSSTLDIDYSKAEKGVINLPINRSFYLEKLLDSKKDINVSKNEKYSELIDSIQKSEFNIEIDKKFEKQMRDYQKVGYKWLKTLEMYKFRWNFGR